MLRSEDDDLHRLRDGRRGRGRAQRGRRQGSVQGQARRGQEDGQTPREGERGACCSPTSERFFVILNRPHEGQRPRFGYQPGVHPGDPGRPGERGHVRVRPADGQAALVHGRAAGGPEHLDWSNSRDLPIIIAANQYQKFAANGAFEGQYMSSSGPGQGDRQVGSPSGGQPGGQYYSIVTDPKAGTIEVLNYSGHRVRFAPDDGKTVGGADGRRSRRVRGAEARRAGDRGGGGLRRSGPAAGRRSSDSASGAA